VQIEGRDVAPLDAEDDLVARPSPVVYVQASQLGNINGVMKDERLRKAYSLSIDREALAAAVLPAGEEPVIVALPITDKWWVYNDEVGGAPAYDPDQAKKLMAEAGHPDGFTMTMTIANREPDKQIAQLLQAMLAQNGITMEIEIVTRDAFVERVVVTRDFDVSQGNIGTPRYDPTQVFDYYLTCDGAVSLTCDPTLDEIIARGAAAADPAERKAIYDEAQAYAVEHVLLTGLFARPATGMARATVHGIEDDVDGPLRFGETWKEQ
jgi:peptide/nickel transport system substrate-binding protein